MPGKDSFRTHIRDAQANATLQAALDANAERRLGGRQQAMYSLPQPWEVMQGRAHAVRAVVIAHLDEYLAQFTRRLEANGVVVLRAAHGADAIRMVMEIAAQNGARRVAKAKTMVSEEIKLNPELEAAGLQVVETDLGEYIVQLRGEHPAHIITPSVHLRRSEVGQTFHEKLDLPYTEDISTLTTAARRILRQVFLDAELGISGVNFGVAESGTLCIVTNEGNGRMVTTLPRVHIALMGIERLVPTLDDLALMLYLLPRSATGQKLSVYTSLIQAPARPGELDGAQKRYVILVDNGRSELRKSPLAEVLYCIRCGACLNACPVFRELGGHAYVDAGGEFTPYSGPVGSIVSPGLFGQDRFGHLARASSLCGACREVCPVDIDLPKLLLRVRAGQTGPISAGTKPPLNTPPKSNAPAWLAGALRLFSWIAVSPRLYAFAQRMLGALTWLASPRIPWVRLPAFTGWGYSKDFPRAAMKPFRDQWDQIEGEVDGIPPAPQPAVGDPPRETPTLLPADRLERFKNELTEVGGQFIACRQDEIGERLMEILSQRGISTLMSWADEYLPPGLLDGLRAGGVDITQAPDANVRAGLTGVSAAVAETGSLLICGGAGRPLSTSLLPEVHIAILREEDILDEVAQALNLDEFKASSSAVLITGPSRTADIEMTLTIGVHGPGELIVVCCSDI